MDEIKRCGRSDSDAHVDSDLGQYVADEISKLLNSTQDVPSNLYYTVMTAVELPLIKATMKYTGNNQSRSAEILKLNRGTFRKKLKFYNML